MPKFRDLKRYLERNGWEQYKKGADHYYYRKFVNGEVLKTKVSHSLGKEIPVRLWKNILKNQLKITQEEFNRNS
ncbi:putative RNA binding protein YcfA (HicA-like mRNA interferase family) [Anoxybacillus voinovskiensis]|uniref:Putative RNA binding protein YcfA (HicA-like mRNA interferase family) n=1 Tax=Anoxybacteroides voinovskiense TaxID=230470 RepID=A0A840DQI4_9BACL|nr:type II toxin-antitoxin system HicA family toxin [Anoxybacillus voinovskiensis]MBB4075334.1 putative RNA binding protein YcfA (HicA-like mRNA interferase family) [Anoxybacillus voinovskiensis]GGJ77921.1 hypothetical protein GCM10008982_29040 [Anoxybacillus voinovskiensis]